MRSKMRYISAMILAFLCITPLLAHVCLADIVVLKVFEDVNGSGKKHRTEDYLSDWTFTIRGYSGTVESVANFVLSVVNTALGEVTQYLNAAFEELHGLAQGALDIGSQSFLSSIIPQEGFEIAGEVSSILIDRFDYACLAALDISKSAVRGDFTRILKDQLAPFITSSLATYVDLVQVGGAPFDFDEFAEDLGDHEEAAIQAGLDYIESEYGVDLVAEQNKPTTVPAVQDEHLFTTDRSGKVSFRTPHGDRNYYIDLQMKSGWVCTRNAGQTINYDNQPGTPTNTYSFGVRRAVIRDVAFQVVDPNNDDEYLNTDTAGVGDKVRVSFKVGVGETVSNECRATIFGHEVAITDPGTSGQWQRAEYVIQASDPGGNIPFIIEFTDDDGFTGVVTNFSPAVEQIKRLTSPPGSVYVATPDGSLEVTVGTRIVFRCKPAAGRAFVEDSVIYFIAGHRVTTFIDSSGWYKGAWTMTGAERAGRVPFTLRFQYADDGSWGHETETTSGNYITFVKGDIEAAKLYYQDGPEGQKDFDRTNVVAGDWIQLQFDVGTLQLNKDTDLQVHILGHAITGEYLKDSAGDGCCWYRGNYQIQPSDPLGRLNFSVAYTNGEGTGVYCDRPTNGKMFYVVPCDCEGGDLGCSDFESWDDAQTCYEHCSKRGLGDIFAIDGDSNGVACETLTPCDCDGGDLGCSDFESWDDAQTCYDHCNARGLGDVFALDWTDKDGTACNSKLTWNCTEIDCEDFDTWAQANEAFNYCQERGFDTSAIDGDGDGFPCEAKAPCDCEGGDLGCSDFDSWDEAQVCYEHCQTRGFGDVFALDWPDKDGTACQGLMPCDCEGSDLGCSDFDSWEDAQSCYEHCNVRGFGDVFALDWSDKDGTACESKLTWNCTDLSCSAFTSRADAQAACDYCAEKGFDTTGVDGNSDGEACEEVNGCDCFDLNCEDFDAWEDATSCYSRCTEQGYGEDILGRIDGDSDGTACEALMRCESLDCADFTTWEDAQDRRNYCENNGFDPSAIDGDGDGTACEALMACNCTSDYCADFSTWEDAQACRQYCGVRGFDTPRLDGDGDGIACESMMAYDCTALDCESFAAWQDAQDARDYCNAAGLDTSAIDGDGDGTACEALMRCEDPDCSDFSSWEAAQDRYDYCEDLGYSTAPIDGDHDGTACDSKLTWDCTAIDCDDFGDWEDAQDARDYCDGLGFDVRSNLDGDSDGTACEVLKRCTTDLDCSNFSNWEDAQDRYDYCDARGYDTSPVDGDGDGTACESKLTWNCTAIDCDDFDNWEDAQDARDYCASLGFDVRSNLDGDNDGTACEVLKRCTTDLDCANFTDWEDAQDRYNYCDARGYDTSPVDGNSNGIACEALMPYCNCSKGAGIDCADFSTQAEAQDCFDWCVDHGFDDLDIDGDDNGEACEALP